jgi:hypothetical protein
LTAPVRRRTAAVFDYWQQAAGLRQEWLDVGSSTEPADREAAESVLTRLYARHGRPRPRFVWAASPEPALAEVKGIPGHTELQQWLRVVPPPGRPPIAVDIAAGWSRMMAALDEDADHPDLDPPKGARKAAKPWPELPPVPALEAGVPLRVVLRRHIRDHLRTALMENAALPVRAALGPPARTPICWYGQQDAYWVGHYDIVRRLGLARHSATLTARLDDWATLARSAGWWWPADDTCVLVERPVRFGPVAYRDGSRYPGH